MKAYKYFDSVLRDSILENGSVRLGTLYDYRDLEKHGPEVGDENEGKVGVNSRVLSWDSSNPSLTPQHQDEFVQGNALVFKEGSSVRFPPGGTIAFGKENISMQNVDLRSERSVQNMLVFSMTAEASAEHCARAGYDACYEISDVEAFLRCISEAVDTNFFEGSNVVYRDRELHYDEAARRNPAFIKEPIYAYQKELRGIWGPVEPHAAAVIVESKDLANLMQEISLE